MKSVSTFFHSSRSRFHSCGKRASCDENYREHLIENELATCMRRTEVYERINRCRILVGTVASISGKPELFRLKHFDVAIVDEATQILEPQLLGILCAKGENGKEGVGKFILIGDHKQLPAVVLQNSEQSEVYDEAYLLSDCKNLKDSLFERLYRTARQHTDAIVLTICSAVRDVCTPKCSVRQSSFL